MTNQARGKRKTRVGTVVSDAMEKTVIVVVGRVQRHPRYDKVVRATTRCYAHDEEGKAGAGDLVRIEECRPMSRLKRWRLLEVLKKGARAAAGGAEEEVREIQEAIRVPGPSAPDAPPDEGVDRAAPEAGAAREGAAT